MLHYACSYLLNQDSVAQIIVCCFVVVRLWTESIDTACIEKYGAVRKLLHNYKKKVLRNTCTHIHIFLCDLVI